MCACDRSSAGERAGARARAREGARATTQTPLLPHARDLSSWAIQYFHIHIPPIIRRDCRVIHTYTHTCKVTLQIKTQFISSYIV